MEFSRDTFYRYQAAVADVEVEALLNANRKKPNFRNRIEESIETAVAAFALEQPAFGQVRVSNELRKRGIFVSPSGVRSVWMRRDLEYTLNCWDYHDELPDWSVRGRAIGKLGDCGLLACRLDSALSPALGHTQAEIKKVPKKTLTSAAKKINVDKFHLPLSITHRGSQSVRSGLFP